GGSTPIRQLIPHDYRKLATHLKRHSLMFAEQLSLSDGRSMLNFYDLSVFQNSPRVASEPA
ncbi:6304_t:CDS:1, partial [Funneliformis geosporum]